MFFVKLLSDNRALIFNLYKNLRDVTLDLAIQIRFTKAFVSTIKLHGQRKNPLIYSSYNS